MQSVDVPTKTNGAGEIELSVEETNKLRARLGLKPLRMSAPGKAPKPGGEMIAPKISTSNNEVSMSVDDTNDLRARLGLKPLNVGKVGGPPSDTKDRSAYSSREGSSRAPIQVDAGKEEREAEAKRRLDQAREKRAVRERVRAAKAGGSLGEQLAASSNLNTKSAAEWAMRVRGRKAQAKEAATGASDSAAGGTKVSGASTRAHESGGADMRVSHDTDSLAAGSTMVLTLQERPMLDDRGRLLDDREGGVTSAGGATEVLENVGLASDARGREAARRREQAKLPVYRGGLGDGEEEGLLLGGKRGRKRRGGVLQHYDDYEEDMDALSMKGGRKRERAGMGKGKGKGNGMVLRADGTLERAEDGSESESESESESDSEGLAVGKRRRVDASGEGDGAGIRSGRAVDFLTAEEARAQELEEEEDRRQRKDGKKKKKNKKLKKEKKSKSKGKRKHGRSRGDMADMQDEEDEDESQGTSQGLVVHGAHGAAGDAAQARAAILQELDGPSAAVSQRGRANDGDAPAGPVRRDAAGSSARAKAAAGDRAERMRRRAAFDGAVAETSARAGAGLGGEEGASHGGAGESGVPGERVGGAAGDVTWQDVGRARRAGAALKEQGGESEGGAASQGDVARQSALEAARMNASGQRRYGRLGKGKGKGKGRARGIGMGGEVVSGKGRGRLGTQVFLYRAGDGDGQDEDEDEDEDGGVMAVLQAGVKRAAQAARATGAGAGAGAVRGSSSSVGQQAMEADDGGGLDSETGNNEEDGDGDSAAVKIAAALRQAEQRRRRDLEGEGEEEFEGNMDKGVTSMGRGRRGKVRTRGALLGAASSSSSSSSKKKAGGMTLTSAGVYTSKLRAGEAGPTGAHSSSSSSSASSGRRPGDPTGGSSAGVQVQVHMDEEEGIVQVPREQGGGSGRDTVATASESADVAPTAAEPTVLSGAAAALAMFAQQGSKLGQRGGGGGQPLAGRSTDSKRDWHEGVVPQIKLEYTDEFGRPQTQKEAYRDQSYQMQGRQPGHKARAKRLRAVVQQQEAAKRAREGNLAASTLVKAARARGAAFAKLPGQ